jgi:hypothetical protein
VDLNAERRRVRELIYKHQEDVARFVREHEKMSLDRKTLGAKIVALESEVETIRQEARAWAYDRDVSRKELDKALADMLVVRGSVDGLKAQCEAYERENKKLRSNAFDIVKTEMECENKRREDLADSRIAAIQRQSDHAREEWKKRNEILRDELAAALSRLKNVDEI